MAAKLLNVNETLINVNDVDVVVEKRNKPKNGYRSATWNELFSFVCLKTGTSWTPDQKLHRNNTLSKRGVGPYEVSYRMARGYSLDNISSTRSGDIPEENSDVKAARNIRFGDSAREHWELNCRELFLDLSVKFGRDRLHDRHLHPTSHIMMTYSQMLAKGVSQSVLRFLKESDDIGVEIARAIEELVKPSKFVKHDSIIAGADEGYIVIARQELDTLSWDGISKGEPKYSVSRAFLENKIKLILLEDSPDIVAIDAGWEMINEASGISVLQPSSHVSAADVDGLSS